MKKLLILLIVLLCGFGMLFAVNNQKIYPIDSEVYEAITHLYIANGYALPSTAGPWSGEELLFWLNKISPDELSEQGKSLFNWIKNTIEEPQKPEAFRLGLDVAAEGYAHTNTTEHFQGRENWRRGFNEQKPFVNIYSDAWIGQNFYGYSEFSLRNSITLTNVSFGETALSSNIIVVPPHDVKQIDFNFPYRAFLAAGGKNWNVQIGREQLSWGPGTTGNFIIGDHLPYHNVIRATGFEKNFKYTLLTSFFPHPQNYYYYGTDHEDKVYIEGVPDSRGQEQYINGISLFMGHRLEWRVWQDKINIALTEGIMYMSKDNRLDFIALSPAMLWHNNYTRSLTNSILALEVDATLLKGWNIYAQTVIDEMILPGEPIPGKPGEDKAEPSAWGYMLGSTYQAFAGKGVWHLNIEGAYTDPFLYLRDGGMQTDNTGRFQNKGQYGINYVVAVREQAGAGGSTRYNEHFLGYQYGGDAIVGNLNGGYRVFDKWNVEGNLFYMAHGSFDKWTVWSQINGTSNPSEPPKTPTVGHPNAAWGNQNDDNPTNRDAISHTFVLGASGSYAFLPNLTLYGQVDYIYIKNPKNRQANGSVSDMQFSLGVLYSL
jgi:hypothetical protein